MSDPRFGDRMIAAMKAQKISRAELHRRSGVSYDVLRELERRPDSSTSEANAVRIARALGLALGEAGPLPLAGPGADDAALVPVYDVAASAGPGAYVDYEMVVDQLQFPPDYLRRITSTPANRLAIITVKGDSMEPTLKDGDIVMVDGTKKSAGFDGLFVLLRDGTLHVKRLSRGARPGMVMVRSDNDKLYPAYEVPIEEVETVGKVLWSGRKE